MKTFNKFKIIILISIISFSYGCSAKMLNPVGESEFSCSRNDGGVCASLGDVYKNRGDIDAFRESQNNPLYGLNSYIEEKCTIHKLLDDDTSYNNCVKEAKKTYKQIQKSSGGSIPVISQNSQTLPQSLNRVVQAKEGIPIRQPESVARIWIAPYENDMGDLVFSHFIYVVKNRSNWVFTPEEELLHIRNNSNPLLGQ